MCLKILASALAVSVVLGTPFDWNILNALGSGTSGYQQCLTTMSLEEHFIQEIAVLFDEIPEDIDVAKELRFDFEECHPPTPTYRCHYLVFMEGLSNFELEVDGQMQFMHDFNYTMAKVNEQWIITFGRNNRENINTQIRANRTELNQMIKRVQQYAINEEQRLMKMRPCIEFVDACCKHNTRITVAGNFINFLHENLFRSVGAEPRRLQSFSQQKIENFGLDVI